MKKTAIFLFTFLLSTIAFSQVQQGGDASDVYVPNPPNGPDTVWEIPFLPDQVGVSYIHFDEYYVVYTYYWLVTWIHIDTEVVFLGGGGGDEVPDEFPDGDDDDEEQDTSSKN